ITGSSVWSLVASESTNGTTWSTPVTIEASGESYAPTTIGTGADPHDTNNVFHVYYSFSSVGGFNRWTDSVTSRRTVTLAGTPDTTAPTKPGSLGPFGVSPVTIK